MQSFALFFSAILFILSSGLIYNERFRKNAPVLGIAVTLAVCSTLAFIYGVVPASWYSTTPSPATKVAGEPRVAPSTPVSNEVAAEPAARECDWDAGESVTRCIERLSRTLPRREATFRAFEGLATREMLDDQFGPAEGNFSVALDNSSEQTMPRVLLFRGMTRIYLEKYSEALSDCDRANTPQSRSHLTVLASLARISMGDIETWFGFCRGVALSHLGRHREALPLLDTAINSSFGGREAYYARHLSRKATGDSEGAQSDARIWVTLTMDALTVNSATENASGH